MAFAKIRTDALVLVPVDPDDVPPNSIFSDATDGGTISSINASGVQEPIGSWGGGGGGESALFSKLMVASVAFSAGTPVSKRSDGRVEPVDRDAPNGQVPVGIATTASAAPDAIVSVFLTGPNLPGVLTGRGFAPGKEIYSANVPGGMVDSTIGFNFETDAVLRLGISDCGAGVASTEATDLIISMEIVSSPSA
jgi:hypothetical protein